MDIPNRHWLTHVLDGIRAMLLAVLLILGYSITMASEMSATAKGFLERDTDPPSPRAWKLTFKGNEIFSNLVLRDVVAVEPPTLWKKLFFWRPTGPVLTEAELKKDEIRLERFYQRRGFHNVEVQHRMEEKSRSWKKKITFDIEERKPVKIRNITIRYEASEEIQNFLEEQRSYNKALQSQSYREGKRYAKISEPDVKGKLIHTLKNLGFAYADMDIAAQVDSTQNAADLKFTIRPGPRTYIDSLRVTGRFSVTPAMVKRNSGLNRGEYFSENKLQDAQRELFNHPLFRFATISIPDQPRDSSLTLLVRVREHENRSVGIKLGVGREDIVRGQVNWTHRNVGHLGHRFNVTAHASFIEQQLSMEYLFPYVFNVNSSFLVNPFAQHLLEPNYELYRVGFNNSLIYQYSRNLTSSISYEYTRNYELTRDQYAELPDTTRDYNISAIQLSGFYASDLQQDKGWAVRPYMEFSGLFGSASFEFQKFVLDLRRYVQLTGSTTLAGRVEMGTTFYHESDSLPNPIRFYAGGTNSVRGWDRHMLGPKRAVLDEDGQFQYYVPRGGRSKFMFNVELRQQLDAFIDGLGMAVFLDGGQIWQRVEETAVKRPLRYGAGGGFRYDSPIGPVRIDLGYKLNPSPKDLDRYRGQDFGNYTDHIAVHFSIGQSF